MREHVARLLARREALALAALLAGLSTWTQGVGFLLGLALTLLLLWGRRWDWAYLGARHPDWVKDCGRAVKYVLLMLLAVDALVQPLVNRALGEAQDLSEFAFLAGDLTAYFAYLPFMWITAACGEELFFRGYLLRGAARELGGSRRAWIGAGILSTLVFGLAHAYQGASGVINTALVGGILAVQYARKPEGLVSCILAHGLYNTVGLTLLYFDQADFFDRLMFGGSPA